MQYRIGLFLISGYKWGEKLPLTAAAYFRIYPLTGLNGL